ncbi:MAG TPA: pyridoxamine 5'-phosphate oxidase family protein [Gemmatimonadaceae bacterium]|nr:pyridoxamine 5'-phosphate oxidase family protein [Gemmatimonadaceae bacterium]
MRNVQALGKAKSTGRNLFPIPDSPQDLPIFKTLQTPQCEAILLRNDVGRIAFALDDRVQILPVHYAYRNGWIHGRTAAPTYLPRNARVAFEVDERSSSNEWRTIIVHGQLDIVESGGAEQSRGVLERARLFFQQLLQPALVESPAVLFRDQLFCIRAGEIAGRASLPVEGRIRAS